MAPTLAYYVHHLSPDLVKFNDSIAVHWYGLSYVVGFYLAFLVMHSLAKRGMSEIKPEAVADFITMTAIFGMRPNATSARQACKTNEAPHPVTDWFGCPECATERCSMETAPFDTRRFTLLEDYLGH